ncbi:hypothetical protein NI456_08020 [Brevundimonas diminuta]|uniref:hypothetical protein n=1 Tax=Brevundimonas TaxID=41275 RepID=UPI0002A395D6|nr:MULTISPECIES: hypothetical protein [Brevundimonas]EKY24275.1 hypothetical protein HMPREF0185_03345 [Brevundimonas diminuta 470-4]HAC01525.1 hypothetical protein [Brevundimonas sp.]MCO8018807.1 hypothetical protein [Brevundimonas diminuta]MCO8021484.1 hypothetical protein [Brevundimonas diminuta]HCW50134.1 hypothetical protein [Brevundimonas sp.]
MTPKQSEGRARNAATPGGKPQADESDEAVERVGRESRKRAGPDGPDATVVGDIFKRPAERPPNG